MIGKKVKNKRLVQQPLHVHENAVARELKGLKKFEMDHFNLGAFTSNITQITRGSVK